jgi:hypothetical protein
MTKKIVAGPTTKERILTTLEAGYGITVAAKQAGITVSQLKNMICTDKTFAVAVDAAQADGVARVRDEALVIIRKCAAGEDISSTRLAAAQRMLDYAETVELKTEIEQDEDEAEIVAQMINRILPAKNKQLPQKT